MIYKDKASYASLPPCMHICSVKKVVALLLSASLQGVVHTVFQMDESDHTCEWVMAHAWMRHATYINVVERVCATEGGRDSFAVNKMQHM